MVLFNVAGSYLFMVVEYLFSLNVSLMEQEVVISIIVKENLKNILILYLFFEAKLIINMSWL